MPMPMNRLFRRTEPGSLGVDRERHVGGDRPDAARRSTGRRACRRALGAPFLLRVEVGDAGAVRREPGVLDGVADDDRGAGVAGPVPSTADELAGVSS